VSPHSRPAKGRLGGVRFVRVFSCPGAIHEGNGTRLMTNVFAVRQWNFASKPPLVRAIEVDKFTRKQTGHMLRVNAELKVHQ
jgi:hypothetical protein